MLAAQIVCRLTANILRNHMCLTRKLGVLRQRAANSKHRIKVETYVPKNETDLIIALHLSSDIKVGFHDIVLGVSAQSGWRFLVEILTPITS